MKPPPTRLLLLTLGAVSAGTFLVQALSGGKPDDALLAFAGSMFATYAITERDDEPPKGDGK